MVPKTPLFKPKKPVIVSRQVFGLNLDNGTTGDPLPSLGNGLVIVDTPRGRAVGLNASFASSLKISGQDLKGFNATMQLDWPIRPGKEPVALNVVQISWSSGVLNDLTIELPGPAPQAVVRYGRNGISYPMPWNDDLNRLTFIKSGDLLKIYCNGKSALTLRAGGNALGSITLNMPEGTTVYDLVLSERYIDYE